MTQLADTEADVTVRVSKAEALVIFELLAREAAHHIVAGGSKAAKDAREHLANLGININDAANGVFLPRWRISPNPGGAAVHSTLHTAEYYRYVNARILAAETKEQALEALDNLRQWLLSGGR